MQFDRKRWVASDMDIGGSYLNNPNNFMWTFKKFGFTYTDGSEITTEKGYRNLKYKYDNNNQIYFSPDMWGPSQSYWAYMELYVDGVFKGYTAGSPAGDYICSFFIPLKNNGLMINSYNNSAFTPAGDTPTPPLYNPHTRPYGSWHSNTDWAGTSTIIFYNNITNLFNYIYLSINNSLPSRNFTSGKWNRRDIYFQNGKSKSLHDNGIIDSSNTGEKTDVKQNICTMIKYPYENGFLSNLFLITTAPTRERTYTSYDRSDAYVINEACGLDNKFFSFNGRNFYGIYANLAVELPAN